MPKTRMLLLALVAVLAALVGPWSPAVWADSGGDNHSREMTIAGFADVPGSTLQLPLAAGASPVTINLTLGIPSVTIPVQITTTTQVKSDFGLPVTLTDGDRIEVDIRVVGTTIRADKIQVEAFPELDVIGTVKGLPTGGVTLPLAAGTHLDFTITLGASAVDLKVRLTSSTKIRGHLTSLKNGDTVQIEAAVRSDLIVITEINHATGSGD